MPTPVHVVDYEDFMKLAERVGKLEEEGEFLRSLLVNHQWLNRSQTMTAIGCSDNTLKRLTDANKIEHRYEGIKPFYNIFSVRNYLTGKNIEASLIDRRLLDASSSTSTAKGRRKKLTL